jgi:hypothetical protein
MQDRSFHKTSSRRIQLYTISFKRCVGCHSRLRVRWKLTELVQQEKNRQKHFINLIPSENFTSQAVLDALGSVMQSMSCAFSHTF